MYTLVVTTKPKRRQDCAHRAQSLPMPKSQPEVIQDLDLVCRISPKILWIHYLVSVSNFAKFCKNWALTVSEILINLLQSPIPRWWGNWTRSCAAAKRPRDASCLYSFYTLEWCGYPMVKKIWTFIRFDMIHEREKIAVFMYHSPHFCFPWRRPCNYHAMYCIDGKTIQCLPNPLQHVPIYLQ